MAPSGWNWKRFAKIALKTVLALLVAAYLYRHIERTWRDLAAHGESIRFDPLWALVGGFLYVAGLTACGVFYAQVMAAGAPPVGGIVAIRAYLISHLGKYVPGKALVIVMRVGLMAPYGARPATAALATFYETLAMMAAGALVAVVGFALGPRPIQRVPLGMSVGLAVLLLAVVAPSVFPRVSQLLTMPFPNVGPDALPRLSYRLLGTGLAWSWVGWVLLGLSQVAVVRAVSPTGVAPGIWPVVTAGVALATVAGFVVAVLPGGLGVREGVLMATLAPAVGEDTAVVAALALRLVWVAAEVVAGGVLAVARPRLPVSKAVPSS
jgi:glycosyltransferase 2 family protein